MLATRQQALVILLPVRATLQLAPAILQQVLATPQLALVSVTEIRNVFKKIFVGFIL